MGISVTAKTEQWQLPNVYICPSRSVPVKEWVSADCYTSCFSDQLPADGGYTLSKYCGDDTNANGYKEERTCMANVDPDFGCVFYNTSGLVPTAKVGNEIEIALSFIPYGYCAEDSDCKDGATCFDGLCTDRLWGKFEYTT